VGEGLQGEFDAHRPQGWAPTKKRSVASSSSQQSPSVFVPKQQRRVVAFPHAAIATAPAARGWLGWRLSEVVASGLQAFLKLRNAPTHGSALGGVGVDDGVLFVRGHALLSISSCMVFCRSVASAPTKWTASICRLFCSRPTDGCSRVAPAPPCAQSGVHLPAQSSQTAIRPVSRFVRCAGPARAWLWG